ncbi:MAG: hypothetical protein ACRCTE_01420 [Cellulosilyticaceae bacterium]
MKIKCGRCGAEYSEIRKVCPKCHEESKYATYVGAEIDKGQMQSGSKEETEQRKVIYISGTTKQYKGLLCLLLLGILVIIGKQLFYNYQVDYQMAYQLKEIPAQKVQIGEVVDLEYNDFAIKGAEVIGEEWLAEFIPQSKKLVAIEMQANNTYHKKSKSISSYVFYAYYKGDEYVKDLDDQDVLELLEKNGYSQYYGMTYEDEKSYMFYVVDQDAEQMTLVYPLINQSFMLGEYIEKFYEIDLEIRE